MYGKKTAVLLGAAAVVAAAVLAVKVFFPEGEPGLRGKKLFPEFKPSRVMEMEIRNVRGSFLFVRNELGRIPWSLRLPEGRVVEGDRGVIAKILKGFGEMVVEMDYGQSEERFGLSPEPSATMRLKGEDLSEEFLVGAADVGNLRYLQVKGRRGTFLVDSEIWEDLFKGGFEYRDKDCFSIPLYKVEEARLEGSGRERIVLKRALGEGWILEVPGKPLADKSRVDELIAFLAGMKVVRFVQEETIDLTPYSLLEPRFRITFKGNRVEETLSVGDEAGEEVYVKREDRPWVGAVSRVGMERLAAGEMDLREWRILPGLSDRILKVTAEAGGEKWVLQNFRSESGEESWRLVFPMELEVERGVVDGVLGGIKELRAREFLPPGEIPVESLQPVLRVGLELDTPEKKRKFFLGPVRGDDRIGWRDEEESLFLILERDVHFLFETSYFHLRKRRLLALHGDAVQEFQARGEGRRGTFRRKEVGAKVFWEREGEDGEGREVELKRIEALLLPLLELTVLAFVGEKGEGELAERGLDPGRYFLDFRVQERNSQEKTRHLAIGKEGEKGYYATLDGDPHLFLLEKKFVSALLVLLE